MRFDATPNKVMTVLRARFKDTPSFASLLPMYNRILKMEENISAPAPEFEPTTARALLEQGTPLLQGSGTIPILEPMVDVWRQVCDLARDHLVGHTDRLEEMRDWVDEDRAAWVTAMSQYFRDGEVSAQSQEEKDILTFLLMHTWRPFLRGWATALAPLVDSSVWKQSRCPICGGQPDLAYLGQEAGERHLVCARCDTEYQYQRLGCPFCGNQDASTYGYYPDEEGVYRLYACGNCKRYLKVLDERQAGAERLLMVERIATIEMDISALQAGYRGA